MVMVQRTSISSNNKASWSPLGGMADLSAIRVLVIEDQDEAKSMMKQMLIEIGISQIYEACNGREGLSFLDIADDMIDMIISDWNMPSMSGLALLRQLKSVGSDLPFMMVTGRGDKSSVIDAKVAGVAGYILKPFSMTQLEAKLRIICTRYDII